MAYRLLLVAFSICSSRAVLAEDDHQLIILRGGDDAMKGFALDRRKVAVYLKKMDREGEVKHWGSDWGRVQESSAPQIVHQPRDTSGTVTLTEPLPTVEGLYFSVLVS